MPSSHCPNTAVSTPLPRSPSAPAMQHPHSLHTATTLQQRRHNVILTQLHAALKQPSRPPHCDAAARRWPAAHCPPLFALHNAPTPQQRSAKQPSRSSVAAARRLDAVRSLTALTAPSRRCTPLLTAPPPSRPLFALHKAPTPLPHSSHAAEHSPRSHRRRAALPPLHGTPHCPNPPPPPSLQYITPHTAATPPRHRNAAVAPPSRCCTLHWRCPRAAPRPHTAPAHT